MRPGRRAAVERLHHRSLDFDEAARFELPPQRADDAGARGEDREHLGIGDQVEVALAVAQLDVLQAVVLLGDPEQVLGEEDELVDVHRQFTGARAEEIALDADDVAEVE